MAPLRILQIIPNLKAGGAERLVLNISQELSKRSDVEVKLLLLEDGIDYPELVEGLDYEITPSRYVPSMTGKSIRKLDHYQKVLNRFQPDIIHSHLFQAEVFARSALWPSAQYFCHFHSNMEQFERFGLHTLTSKQRLTRYYERHLLMRSYRKQPTHFIAISKDVEAFVRKQLPAKAGSVHMLPNAIDLDRFSPAVDRSNQERVQLVTVGRLDQNKNHHFLLRVIGELRKDLPGIHLEIIGAGPLQNQLEAGIQEFGLQQNVTLSGHSSEPEKTLHTSTIYVHSARQEGFGLTAVEAMACGLPVVALAAGGNRDVIQDGENGYLLPQGDISGFVGGIKRLASDKELYEEMSRNALATARKYSMDTYADQLLQLYRSAV